MPRVVLLRALLLGSAWSVTFLVQLVFVVETIASSSFTYMGGGDARTIWLAWTAYRPALIGTFFKALLLDTNGVFLLLLPVLLVVPRRSTGRHLAFAALAGALGRLVLVTAGLVVRPSLFWQGLRDGPGRLLFAFCSAAGPFLVVPLTLAVAYALTHGAPRRARLAALAPLAALGAGWLVWLHVPPAVPVPTVPPGSVVLAVIDSLRADAIGPERTPVLWKAMTEQNAVWVEKVYPPLARTAPALTSLLTSKLPEESGVTTMFSPQSSFDQRDSVVRDFAALGYCTVVVGEYPAEFFRKIDFGFERNETPQVRFKEIALGLLLSKDHLALSLLSSEWVRGLGSKALRDLFEGLPEFGDAAQLVRRFEQARAGCGDRPVFALLFADQPHFPYVQSWPEYQALDPGYGGPFRYAKDAISEASAPADRLRIRDLYWASLRASEKVLGAWAEGVASASPRSTVVVTGDHGESLYDERPGGVSIMGHGDQLDEPCLVVPFIVFGEARPRFESLAKRRVSNIHLAWRLLPERQGRRRAPTWPEDVLFFESGLWMADMPSVPKERVRYPTITDTLEVPDPTAQMEIKPEYRALIELAKHRRVELGGRRYDFVPGPRGLTATRDGLEVPLSELEPVVLEVMRRWAPSFAAYYLN